MTLRWRLRRAWQWFRGLDLSDEEAAFAAGCAVTLAGRVQLVDDLMRDARITAGQARMMLDWGGNRAAAARASLANEGDE